MYMRRGSRAASRHARRNMSTGKPLLRDNGIESASAGYESMRRKTQDGGIVLLTGGSGRTGRIIAQRLVASRGYRLRVLTRSAKRATAALDSAGVAPADYDIVVGDVTSQDDLRRALTPDVRHVVYAAGGENVDATDVNCTGVDRFANAAEVTGSSTYFL